MMWTQTSRWFFGLTFVPALFLSGCKEPVDPAEIDFREADDLTALAGMDLAGAADLQVGADLRSPDLSPASLCMPAGNLIPEGSLDRGMSGQVPVGFSLRTPGQPERCNGSGTPAQHVFASAPAPSCSGAGITVDARGQWDCYAVQVVSPYKSIQGGSRYLIRAATRSTGNATNPGAWFFLGAQWLDGMDRFFGDEKNPRPTNPAQIDHDWQVIEWEVVAPPAAQRILLWMTAHHPGKVEFDHIGVYRIGS